MNPPFWQHQMTEPNIASFAREATATQPFVAGLLAGVVLASAVLLCFRSRLRSGSVRQRRAIVTGWGDLFRLLGSLLRGTYFLVFTLLLLARVFFWPAGRRW